MSIIDRDPLVQHSENFVFWKENKGHHPLFFGIGSWEESVTQYGVIVFDEGNIPLKGFTGK